MFSNLAATKKLHKCEKYYAFHSFIFLNHFILDRDVVVPAPNLAILRARIAKFTPDALEGTMCTHTHSHIHRGNLE